VNCSLRGVLAGVSLLRAIRPTSNEHHYDTDSLRLCRCPLLLCLWSLGVASCNDLLPGRAKGSCWGRLVLFTGHCWCLVVLCFAELCCWTTVATAIRMDACAPLTDVPCAWHGHEPLIAVRAFGSSTRVCRLQGESGSD